MFNTLEKIISSKARAAFFSILFGIDKEEVHLREIQRRSGLAIETVRKEANNLIELGLILRRPSGNRVYYKANSSHQLYREIHQMVLKTSGILWVLKDSLMGQKIYFAFIFGSLANGKATTRSDVDLFIIGDISFRTVSALLKEPAEMIGREINPHIMPKEDFLIRLKEKEHFISEVFNSPRLMILGDDYELTGMAQ